LPAAKLLSSATPTNGHSVTTPLPFMQCAGPRWGRHRRRSFRCIAGCKWLLASRLAIEKLRALVCYLFT